jgi:hypothetical protein
MDLALVGGRGACEQNGIPFIESDSNAPHGKFEGRTTTLKTTTQHCDAHSISSVGS